MRSLYLSFVLGVASLAWWLAAPSAADAQVRTVPVTPVVPRVNFGTLRTNPFPGAGGGPLPPRIIPSTIQTNLNYWAYGTYPNLVNPYAAFYSAYNPYMTNYGYNPYLSSYTGYPYMM